jgi:dTDP-glucose pyrophosphorylase
MPMGGLGQRFRDQGYETPKPLIQVEGRAMFLKALESFEDLDVPKSYIFVIRADQNQEYNLAKKITSLLPEAKVNILDHNTQGAVETCLIAEKDIKPDCPIIIMDCDFRFSSKEYNSKVVSAINHGEPDGILLCFPSDNPRYSYAKLKNQNVVETAEKKVISSNAIAGAYYFNKASSFLDSAHKLLKIPISENMKEYYLSLIYNILIKQDKSITIARIDDFNSFGTPEELKSFLSTDE